MDFTEAEGIALCRRTRFHATPTHTFANKHSPQLLITIPAGDDATHVQAFIPGKQALPTSTASLDFPLKVSATYEQMYYVPPAGMNILQMLKSPMVLMMLFSGVMAFAVPKMTVSTSLPSLPQASRQARRLGLVSAGWPLLALWPITASEGCFL